MKEKEFRKKTFLWVLVITTFIILFILWRVYLKFLTFKTKKYQEVLPKKLEEETSSFLEEFKNIFQEIKSFKISNLNLIENKEEKVPPEIKKLKEKVLEYLNQENKSYEE